MKKSLFLAVACVLAAGSAHAQLAADLKGLADRVREAKVLWTQGTLPADLKLDDEIAALTRLLDGGKLNEAGRSVAHAYRGDARLVVNAARAASNHPPSVDAAREALADYDRVIRQGKDIPDWGVDVANTTYYAGWISQRYLRSEPLAHWYWQKCADAGHRGCVMTVAAASVSGVGDVRVDAERALALNEQAWGNGTQPGCAAAYAARNNALIIFFMKTRRPAKETFEWLERARRQHDVLAREQGHDAACNRAKLDMLEFLIRYANDDRAPALLDLAVQRAVSHEDRMTVRYLQGQLNEEQFRAEIARTPARATRCGMHFVAMWNAEVNRNHGLARDHYKAMYDLGVEACGEELAYVKKFGR